jgi:hypothetical protein
VLSFTRLGAAEFLQLLPPLLPGVGIERANLAILVQPRAGDDLGPKNLHGLTIYLPASTSHTLMVVSKLAETSRLPSPLRARLGRVT